MQRTAGAGANSFDFPGFAAENDEQRDARQSVVEENADRAFGGAVYPGHDIFQ